VIQKEWGAKLRPNKIERNKNEKNLYVVGNFFFGGDGWWMRL